MLVQLRYLLLPFAIGLELVLLACGWIMALPSPAKAARLVQWAENHLPSLNWYLGRSEIRPQERGK